MQLERSLAVLDIESTGTDPQADSILELGIVILAPDGTRKRWEQRFNPGRPIPPEATAIHGITDADVAECPRFAEWAERIHGGLEEKDLAGFNLKRFDLPLLDSELRRCGLNLDLTGVRVIDCYAIFAKKSPRRLEDAVLRYCGRVHEDAHSALADAEATADVLLGQLAEHVDLAALSLDELAEYSRMAEGREADLAGKLYWDKDGELRFAFGKNKDRRVLDELGYVSWMLRAGDFPGSTCDLLREATDNA